MSLETHEQPPNWSPQGARGPSTSTWNVGPATTVLIAISGVVALLSNLGSKSEALLPLFITIHSHGPLVEVFQGQIWRLLTPIFIHFGIMHLLFNMLWLKDLGTAIERRTSTGLFLRLVVVIGVLSNLGQYLFVGPFFGGMSGVVYGLLGYVWMKSRFDPASGFYLHKQTVIMMIGWFFLCLTGALGPVANAAHGVGLVTGIVWGFFSPKTPKGGSDVLPGAADLPKHDGPMQS